MKKVIPLTLLATALLAPAVVSAQFGQIGSTFSNLLGFINSVLVPLVFGVALLFFLWGLARFILSAGDEAAKESGRRLMIWGIVALAIMASVWGLVRILTDAFGVQRGGTIETPDAPRS